MYIVQHVLFRHSVKYCKGAVILCIIYRSRDNRLHKLSEVKQLDI